MCLAYFKVGIVSFRLLGIEFHFRLTIMSNKCVLFMTFVWILSKSFCYTKLYKKYPLQFQENCKQKVRQYAKQIQTVKLYEKTKLWYSKSWEWRRTLCIACSESLGLYLKSYSKFTISAKFTRLLKNKNPFYLSKCSNLKIWSF